MRTTVLIILFLFSILLLVNCRGQTEEEKMLKTSSELVSSFQDNQETKFVNLIGVELKVMGKNEEMIHNDYRKIKGYFDKYVLNKDVDIVLTEHYNPLGMRLVEIPIYKGNDSITKIKEVKLEVFFGPQQYVPLNKISGYNIIVVK